MARHVCIIAPFKVAPPIGGAARRVYELSLGLQNAGVSVTLLHAGESACPLENFQVIGFPALENLVIMNRFKWSRALDVYFSSLSFELSQRLMRIIRKSNVDLLQLETPWPILAVKSIRTITHRVPLVYDAHNVERLSTRSSSHVPWLWPAATWLEKQAIGESDTVLCVSEIDKANMCTLYNVPASKVAVIPNGVRSTTYQKNSRHQIRNRLGLQRDAKIIFFHGALGWKPNSDAALTIVKSISNSFQANDKAVFVVAGPDPHTKLLELAKERRNVKLLGYVPDIEDYICAADVCIAPLKSGSGTRLKILEYLAAGKPVVSTRKAVEGINVRDNVEALIVNDVDENFLSAIGACMNPSLAERLGENARMFVEQFEWSIIGKRLARIQESTLLHARLLQNENRPPFRK